MRARTVLWLVAAVLLLYVPALAAMPVEVTYYYGDTCPLCYRLAPYIDSIPDRFPGIKFEKKEVWKNTDNAVAMYRSLDRLSNPPNKVGVPLLVVGDKALVGYKEINEKADSVITQETGIARTAEFKPKFYADFLANVYDKIHRLVGFGLLSENRQKQEYGLSALSITAAAIADSVNPCAILVLVVLLTVVIIETTSKLRLMATAASFISAVYIAYLLIGMGLVSTLGTAAALEWFYWLIGGISILVGLANVKDFIKPGALGFVAEIPKAWRPTLMKYLARATSPGSAFAVGFLVTLFELPCTGGPYLFAISLMAGELTMLESLPWLLYYNLIFIAPLIVISSLVICGIDIEAVELWQQQNIRVMHLVSGIIMLLLGLFLILSR